MVITYYLHPFHREYLSPPGKQDSARSSTLRSRHVGRAVRSPLKKASSISSKRRHMNPNDLATKYRLLNSSFKKTMIYHIGIDAGFFTEYTYMLHAMLYCLQHKIQFKLYSDDANFGWEKGWEDCFVTFLRASARTVSPHLQHPSPAFVASIDARQEIAQDEAY